MVELLNANPSSLRPLIDLHHAELYLAWGTLLHVHRFEDLKNVLYMLSNRLFTRRFGQAHIPFINGRNSIETVFEFAATHEKPDEFCDTSSVYLLCLMELVCILPDEDRDTFLSRVFGLFNEEPVRIWGESEVAPYKYLGRPTLFPVGDTKYTTLDFALNRKNDNKIFVAEMKCELAYQSHKYMVLNSVDQVNRHLNDQAKTGKKSFERFVDSASNPDKYQCKVTDRGQRRSTIGFDGAILDWGKLSDAGRKAVIDQFGFEDVLCVESIINQLLAAKNESYRSFVDERMNWCQSMFDSLSG